MQNIIDSMIVINTKLCEMHDYTSISIHALLICNKRLRFPIL